MTTVEPDMIDQAIAWHLRLDGASQQDWIAFVAWLEADEAHAAAYDRVVLDDSLVAPSLDVRREGRASVQIVDRKHARLMRRGNWLVGGAGALAASLAIAIVLPRETSVPTASSTIRTAPGERRTVMLADGSQVEMNGGTELVVASGDRRRATLLRGQATFNVVHNPDAPFELVAGGTTLRDIGTVFDVTREGDRVGVQVAEGAVMFRPDREAVTVRKGMALATSDHDDRLVLRRVPVESVGGWRANRLFFRDARMRDVAAAIRRTSGQKLVVDRAIADAPFTGTIQLAGDEAGDAANLAALAGVSARRGADGWILTSVADTPD